MGKTAAAIVIGNEVLSGKVQDANGVLLIRRFRELGVELKKVLVVQDDVDAIVEAVASVRFKADVVITSGGVGPTHDDVTVRAVAMALSRRVIRDPVIEESVRAHYGDAVTPEAFRLADAPEGATFVPCPDIWLPVLLVENLALLPGVPELFRRHFEAIAPRFQDSPFHLRCLYLNQFEASFAGILDRVAHAHPDVAIGSYPRFDRDADYKVKLTLESKVKARVDEVVEELLAGLPAQIVVRVE